MPEPMLGPMPLNRAERKRLKAAEERKKTRTPEEIELEEAQAELEAGLDDDYHIRPLEEFALALNSFLQKRTEWAFSRQQFRLYQGSPQAQQWIKNYAEAKKSMLALEAGLASYWRLLQPDEIANLRTGKARLQLPGMPGVMLEEWLALRIMDLANGHKPEAEVPED